MYYVPDGTARCGFYECSECGVRFLDVRIGPSLVCPSCGETPDMEIGPDETMPEVKETAKLLQVFFGCCIFIIRTESHQNPELLRKQNKK